MTASKTAATEKTTTPKIYGAIHAIQKGIKTLQKNGVGPQTQGSYKFLAVDDILLEVKPLMDEHGVISYPVKSDVDFHYNKAFLKEDGRVAKENVQAITKYVFRYVAIEDGSSIDVEVTGEGIDAQDKATRKSTTQAQKIANILTFQIITGDVDPDAQDGGAQNQNESSSPTARRLDNARQPSAPKPPTTAKEQIKAEFVTPGHIDGATLNAQVEKLKGEGISGAAIYEVLLERLRKGEVS